MAEHPWKLVAPWYRWPRQKSEEQRSPIQTRPVFQKFDSPDFVRGFVADPQHSLTFEDKDRVYRTHTTASALKSSKFSQVLQMTIGRGKQTLDNVLCPTPTRKLYLDTHKRYYLVVCELHCDAPGFPKVTPDQVCQAGFVVRRKSSAYPKGLPNEAAEQLQKIYQKQADLAYLDGTMPLRGRFATARDAKVMKLKTGGTYESTLAQYQSEVATETAALAKWKAENGVLSVSEGWLPGDHKNVGSWQPVPVAPTEVLEDWFPLYRLFPNPKAPDHPAKHGTIYYGVVPTSSLDTDARGNARFDHLNYYEIRCFVRRHARECPPTKSVPDCHGPLYWSEPSECYKLAAASDLVGTSQRPVTIHIPDLRELAAQAAGMKLNDFAPMKVVQPQNLEFEVDDQKAKNGSVKQGGFPQICFFAIPLITIVAFFVLRLFLPILVFLFNLYFLLAFRFCILPSVSIDAGIDAKLKVLPPSVDVDAALDVSLGLGTVGDLAKFLQAEAMADANVKTLTNEQKTGLAATQNSALLPIGQHNALLRDVPDGQADTMGVQPTADLHYEVVVGWPL